MAEHSEHDYDLNPPRKGCHHENLSSSIGREGRNGNTRSVRTATFDYPQEFEPDDRGNPLTGFGETLSSGRSPRDEVLMLFADIWGDVIEWVYKPKRPERVAMRFLALCFCTRPGMVGTKSIAVFARQNGTSKQNMHFVTAQFRRQFGSIFGSVRTQLGCEHMKEAAILAHQKRASKEKTINKH